MLFYLLAAVANGARVQGKAPFWKAEAVHNQKFTTLSLDDYKDKWLVMFFYPLDWTFVCPTEIIGFSQRIRDFEKLNAQVVGFSVDSVHSHLAWINTPRNKGGLGSLSFPLVSDITKEISSSYGVLALDGPDKGLALRGTFLIDPNGIIRQISINDLSVGRNIEETIRLLEAYQYADQHGEVCPLGWKQGKEAMVADPFKSKEYFLKNYE